MNNAANGRGEQRPIMVVLGTRPEVIKLAPVVRAFLNHDDLPPVVVVGSGQHAHLMGDFARELEMPIHRDLACGRPDQTLLGLHARLLTGIDQAIRDENPSMMLVQGDTATTLAGAQAAFAHKVPIGHVEAGLRTGNPKNPFPEEMNRRLIGQMTDQHYCATQRNAEVLRAEGVGEDQIHVTGNTVVDAVLWAVEHATPGTELGGLLDSLADKRLVALTTHRRESFDGTMRDRMQVLRKFIDERPDTAMVFPVHPNPRTREAAAEHLGGHGRIHLIDPLGYFDFTALLGRAWLIVTDSGGVQEEAPTLGKPTIVIRPNTERPEALDTGVARLATPGGDALQTELLRAETDGWPERVKSVDNPFGDGKSGVRIARLAAAFVASEPAGAGVR